MKYSPILFAGLLSASVAHGAPLQRESPRFEVKRGEDRELARAARGLNITESSLATARKLLLEATQSFQDFQEKESDSISQTLSQLLGFWPRAHRREAPQRLSEFASQLVRLAEKTEDANRYQFLKGLNSQTAHHLIQLDPRLSLAILQDWPPPPESLGETALQAYQEARSLLSDERFLEKFQSSPYEALSGLETNQSIDPVQAAMGQLMQGTMEPQELDQQLRRSLEALGGDPGAAFPQAIQLAHLVQFRYPERLPAVMEHLASLLNRRWAAGGEGVLYRSEVSEVLFNALEQQYLSLLRNLFRHPALVLEAVEAVPAFAAKVQALGGIDAALRSNPVQSQPEGDQVVHIPLGQGYVGSTIGQASLIRELWEDALYRPSRARMRLRAILEGEGGFRALTEILGQSLGVGDQLTEIIFQVMDGYMEAIPKSPEGLQNYHTYLGFYRAFDGRLPMDLVQRGFQFLEEWRLDHQASKIESPSPGADANNLESFLIAQLARLDYPSAQLKMEAIQDEEKRLVVKLAIIEDLLTP